MSPFRRWCVLFMPTAPGYPPAGLRDAWSSHTWLRGIRVLGRIGTTKGIELLNKALTLPDRGTPVGHVHRAAQAALDRLAEAEEG